MSLFRERWEVGYRLGRRVVENHVEDVIDDRISGELKRALDGRKQALPSDLMRKVANRGHATCSCHATATGEIIQRAKLRGAQEMGVEVDAPRKDQAAFRVQFAIGRGNVAADLDDLPSRDA